MCGICGCIDFENRVTEEDLMQMEKVMSYRGPDDSGTYLEYKNETSIGLGHVRLSVLDLSSAGHQPMFFENLVIVYNGEIYNFKEIRTILEKKGHSFVSNCDTEVILHAFKEWGISCTSYFIGMFAFSIYDKIDRKVYLCRDRAGVKPLYYSCTPKFFMFASELKCMMSYKRFQKEINNDGLFLYLQFGYIPSPATILKGTYKLEPGNWLIFDLDTKKIIKECYWDIVNCYKKDRLSINYEDAKIELKTILKSAFAYRMIADVPVGLFLSGGYDSTLLASILVKELNFKPKTFTIGFYEGNNEAPEAELISHILGTEHTALYCDTKEAKEIIPDLAKYYDEPFSDISAIPTILVSKLAKQQVTVALSADGGDEIFAGYYAYDNLAKYYNKIYRTPQAVRIFYKRMYKIVDKLLPEGSRVNHLASYLDFFYRSDCSVRDWSLAEAFSYERITKKLLPSIVDYKKIFISDPLLDFKYDYRLLYDYKYRMSDQFLTKVDRATMSVSLEGREPLIDHRIAEFVSRLPWDFKYEPNSKKRIERDIVHSYIPKEIMDKPKRGFTIPLEYWLRNDLSSYAKTMINSNALDNCGINKIESLQIYNNFINGNNYHSNLVWRLIQLSGWYNQWMSNDRSAH